MKQASNAPKSIILLRSILWALAVVIVVEALMHVEVIRERLPVPKPYYSDNVEFRLRTLESTLAENGKIDLLFIGSSVVRTDFRPLLFDRVHARQTGEPVVSFNGGLSDLNPDRTRLYLEHFYLPRFTPKAVLQGVRYSEVLNAEPADKFELFQNGYLEKIWLEDAVLSPVAAWLINTMQLLYYKGVIPAALGRRYSLRWTVFPVDRRGYNRPRLNLVEAKAKKGISEAEPYGEALTGEIFAAALEDFRRAHELCRKQGIRYMLVNMPEHGDKFMGDLEAGKERYEFYLKQVREFAQAEGIPFIDITGGDPEAFRDDTLYSDYHHMSGKGAARFTTELSAALAQHEVALLSKPLVRAEIDSWAP